MDKPIPLVLSADTMKGNPVYNRKEERIGEIKEFVLDVQDGRVAYAVLDFGGFLGMGNKLFAVPFQSLTLDSVEKRFLLDIDKERLENAPGFDQDNWPSLADWKFVDQVHTYYRKEPYPRV